MKQNQPIKCHTTSWARTANAACQTFHTTLTRDQAWPFMTALPVPASQAGGGSAEQALDHHNGQQFSPLACPCRTAISTKTRIQRTILLTCATLRLDQTECTPPRQVTISLQD